jgi:hypothetical protein
MTNEHERYRAMRKIAREALSDYNSEGVYQINRDKEGAIILTPQLVRAFPIYPINCPLGPHQYHLNGWINGNRKHLRVFNAQEANTLRPLYSLDRAQMFLGELEKFTEGKREDFLIDTPDNGFITVYLNNFVDVSHTREKLTQIAENQTKSKIGRLTKIAEEARQGFYWPNIASEVVEAGRSFTESREDWGKRRTEQRMGMEAFLAENPEAFRNYFSGLVSFVNGCSRTFEDINSRDLSRFPLLVPVKDEKELREGDYIQGQFFLPGQGWNMFDGEFTSLTDGKVEDRKVYIIHLENASDLGNGTGEKEIKVHSDIENLENPIWRLGNE